VSLHEKRQGLIRKSLKEISAKREKTRAKGKESTQLKQYKLHAKNMRIEYIKKSKEVVKLRLALGGIKRIFKSLKKFDVGI
jgi:hypothetical protein